MTWVMTPLKLVTATVLLACIAAVVVDARGVHHDLAASRRQLQQVNTRCPAGCTSDGCVLDSTAGGYRCTKCNNRLVLREDGTCGCLSGRYAKSAEDCADCEKGSYCLGGQYVDVNNPGQVPCDSGLTTIGKRSTSIKACVNIPGSFYSLDATGLPKSTSCPVDTYGPGLRKQRACVPCPPGYTTRNMAAQSRVQACVVPEGYYLKGPGQVAPCPKGEWKSGFDPLPSCTKCANGVSTPTEASISEEACSVLLPTFYPAAMTNRIITATQQCPQKYYCPGGTPSFAFDPTNPLVLTGTTVVRCPFGTWTQGLGASSADECMTPPGFKTTGGDTVPCADGEYRPEWKPATAASRCIECGESIMSYPIEQVLQYAVTPDATPSQVNVRATSASCYIKPGQGMYFSTASNAYRAVNCDSGNYGVANISYGLAAFPCRDCPAGMTTDTQLPASAAYWSVDTSTPPLGGFTSPMACVTKAGFGYNGRFATKCPAGSYNAAGNYGTCTKCPYGLSTSNDATKQVSISDCVLAPGFGFSDGVIQPCPVGSYNDQLRDNTTAPCTTCPVGLTSEVPGGKTVDDCNLCQDGWGGPGYGSACNIRCGGDNGANYGPAGRAAGQRCTDCAQQSVGFNYDYLAKNQPYSPGVVAPAGAAGSAQCLSEFAQISDTAWFMDGYAALTNVANATTWSDCVADCKDDLNCQYVTYDYDALVDSEKCYKKVAGNGSDIVGFKAVVGGDWGGAASIRQGNRTRARSLASGSYTFWKDDASGIGMEQVTINGVTTVQQCLNACDQAAECAGVVLSGMTDRTSAPAGCSHIYGNSRIAIFKRSMTKAVASRLTLADVL